jgi:hypothetical protein
VSQTIEGAAPATPPEAPIVPAQTEAKAPSPGPLSFQDYVQTLPDDLKAHATKKGWKDYGDAIKAHASSESLIGKKVDLPKLDDPEAVKAHMARLAPADGKYELNYEADGLTVDEGVKGTFEAFLKDNPLPNATAQNLVGLWNGMAKQAHEAQAAKAAEAAAAKDTALTALRSEMGPDNFEVEMNLATKAAAFGGFPDDLLNRLEDVLGTKDFVQCMARLGRLGTEDQFVDGHERGAPPRTQDAASRLYPSHKT